MIWNLEARTIWTLLCTIPNNNCKSWWRNYVNVRDNFSNDTIVTLFPPVHNIVRILVNGTKVIEISESVVKNYKPVWVKPIRIRTGLCPYCREHVKIVNWMNKHSHRDLDLDLWHTDGDVRRNLYMGTKKTIVYKHN